MCGIAGIYSKSPEAAEHIGASIAKMMHELGDRGPDSAGIALYREPAPDGYSKVSLWSPDPAVDWRLLVDELGVAFDGEVTHAVRASHATFVAPAAADDVTAWIATNRPDLRVMSAGRSIEIYKEKGHPDDFVVRFGLAELSASHALAHTRMATESRVTTEHSHPFSSGLDLCLIHNGSLSNHNDLRRRLRREGVTFQTDNDTEVAAGYLMWRMREGDDLEQALHGCLEDIDGFYTFAIGTADGFAVLRDPIACKPAVMAETDDWVAIATEYRAIAAIPGSQDAEVWEPEPARVYTWERVAA